MPPVSPQDDQQNTADDNSPLSDDDVGILYEIITSAEQDSDVESHPFRSIFKAYDTVLARHGLEPDHDQIYLRFLLRLGGKRHPGARLYESFEALLAELGIQIEINAEENEVQDVTRSFNATSRNSPELPPRSEAGSDSGFRSRRASFHILEDGRGEGRSTAGIRSSSRASLTGPQRNQDTKVKERPSTRASIRPSENFRHQPWSRQATAPPARGRMTAREFASNLQHYQRRHNSASATRTTIQQKRNDPRLQSRSKSALGSKNRSRDPSPAYSYQSKNLTRDDEEHTFGQSYQSPSQSPSHHIDNLALLYQPDEAQMLRDADIFEDFRLRALLRNVIQRWRAVASYWKDKNDRMDHVAVNYDLGILRRQSFDQWRGNLHVRIEAAAAEQYFLRMEQRAHRARDLYLLTKAFTHWQQLARERVQFATVTREQILRIKYFDAWLELTVMNQRKVRIQVQRKFFNMWSQQSPRSLRNHHTASLTRNRGLIKTNYWKWFWTFCARRAPQWKDSRLRSNVFNKWVFLYQWRLYQGLDATVQRDTQIKTKTFSRWLQQARSVLLGTKQAEEFHRRKIIGQMMLAYRRTSRHNLLLRQVSNMVDWRIAGSTFATFINRFRVEQQAKKVNQLRVKRNTWTAWNDHLRWQTLENQIDDRVLVQALYRWVLAERCILLQRLCEQRSRHRCFQKLVDRYRTGSRAQQTICNRFEDSRRTRILEGALYRWSQLYETYQQDGQIAHAFEAPRIAQEAVQAWKERLSETQKTKEKAVGANYYFLILRFFRRWRVATMEAKRRHYREAYTHVRRKYKMRLASRCLQRWGDHMHGMVAMQEQAQAFDQRQLLLFGTGLFDHWKNRHAFFLDRQDQTAFEFERRFVHLHLDKWIARLRTQEQKEELAKVNAELRTSNIAFGWLHKLHLRVIELKGQESNAESLRRWYEKRHFHNFLRQWRRKVAERRDRPVQAPIFSSRARRLKTPAPVEGQEEVAGHAEEWTAFDEGFDLGDWIPAPEAQASSTPLPGYLSTPSKRAARARGLRLRVSNETITPVAHLLAAPMRAILPGKPQAKLQAISTARWEGLRLVVYISGNGLMILRGPHNLVQTIYHEACSALIAVTVDESTGKIATASATEVFVYRPYEHEEELLKWSLQHVIARTELEPEDAALSWGTDEDLLIGSTSLRLFQTATEEAEIWSRPLSRPAKIAQFSHDAGLIASTGQHDRLVKLWRRQSFGADDTRFDFTYLPHPTTVTAIHWRRPPSHEKASNHALYVICGDQKIRIWAAIDPHGVQGLQLWAEIDMQASIQPRQLSPDEQSADRFAFFIESQGFSQATALAVEESKKVSEGEAGTHENHALEHLIEVANSCPDLCVILDRSGCMSAWGLENIGSKVQKPTDVFNIAHVENFNLAFLESEKYKANSIQLISFCSEQVNTQFTLLAHHFDGRIEWLDCKLDELFSPAPRQKRIHRRTLWSGHDTSIKKISISLWDARSSHATLISDVPFTLEGALACLVQLPKEQENSMTTHLATVTTTGQGIVWEVSLPKDLRDSDQDETLSSSNLRRFCDFELKTQENLAIMMPIDPAGLPSWTASALDTFAKYIAVSYCSNGTLRTWTAVLGTQEPIVEWLSTSTVDTGVQDPSLASASSIRKSALVDASKTNLTIWDMRSGQLEYNTQYDELHSIQDLDWSSTPDDQALLAIGFSHKVIILAQMRYDYLTAGPAWTPIREIDLKESTPHPIGDSTWLGGGNIVIGAGNQLFVYDKSVDLLDDVLSDLMIPVHTHGSMDLFDLVTYLNGPLPFFHPQFLFQCVLAGKVSQANQIIFGLHNALKYFTDGDELDSFASMTVEDFTGEIQNTSRRGAQGHEYDSDMTTREFDMSLEDVTASLRETLAIVSLPHLSSREQLHLVDVMECISTVERHRRSMDDNATRYLLFFRHHMIGRAQTLMGRPGLAYREIIWAFHSGSQDILIDMTSRQYNGRMLWEHARECGMFMWITDLAALRAQFEVIARNEYTKTDEKNPIDCSLYYLALRKKNVLLGLWRMSAWNREQASTQRLLSNNFQEARWKTAALKNAYALLGKRRFEYAAAFFLLAGNLRDSVNVCLHQMKDLQLAVTVARVYEGDNGLVLRTLLEEKILPQAAMEGNRWLATWAFWMLGKSDLAIRALISPVDSLLDRAEPPHFEAKSYLANDPALVVLYKQLRGKSLQALKGASKISPREEWDFVIRNARLYDRMGCNVLALNLVRNWEFLLPSKQVPSQPEVPPDPRKMLRRRSSLSVDDLTSPISPTGMKAGVGKPHPQKVFEEPDTSSLLDNFGF
ncbi:MAG: hypothetical protein Q9220_005864 [cf. Caloplaca sp. 1 TL-2023]